MHLGFNCSFKIQVKGNWPGNHVPLGHPRSKWRGVHFFHYIKQSARFPSTEPSYSQRAQWISSVLVCGNHGHRYLPSSRGKSKFRKANYTMSCDLKKRLCLFMSSLQKREVRSREFSGACGRMNGRLAALWAEVGTIPEAQGAEVGSPTTLPPPECLFSKVLWVTLHWGLCFNPYCD